MIFEDIKKLLAQKIWGQSLNLLNFHRLDLCFDDTTTTTLDEYFIFDKEKIRELKLRQTYQRTREELLELISRFPNLETLEFDQLNEKYEQCPVGQQGRLRNLSYHQKWSFVKRVVSIAPKLKRVVAFTSADRENIREQLGSELSARFKLEFRGAIFNHHKAAILSSGSSLY
ncbi:hypothetical protein TWF694_009330 [Orbilia ellipsospora]|uniref:Uncharacterized protein n=1 Tax=Orbilia ellipsospora TaxID=2528407 RepID=A0AAV9XHB4_9PEZI